MRPDALERLADRMEAVVDRIGRAAAWLVLAVVFLLLPWLLLAFALTMGLQAAAVIARSIAVIADPSRARR